MSTNLIKLGIIVVYWVDDDNEKLLDIHLNQLKENTSSSFTIYACINLLKPRFLDKLNEYNFIRPIICREYVGLNDIKRGAKEHSYYLSQLINIAINDGVSHIAIFHPDSFPVRKNWNYKYLNLLTDNIELISIFPHMTGFMLFSVAVYKKYNPNLLPSNEEQISRNWRKFEKYNKTKNLIESGMGFAYNIFSNGKKWLKLSDIFDTNSIQLYGEYFDNSIFHLGSASDYKNRARKNITINKKNKSIIKGIVGISPNFIKKVLKNNFTERILFREISDNNTRFLNTRSFLFDETKAFINLLKTGKFDRELKDVTKAKKIRS